MEQQTTEQEFITAFWKLYDILPIEKISIQRLCRTAGYNRSTFYNHFTDIYALQDTAFETFFQPIKTSISSLKDFRMFLRGNTAETILSSYFLKKDNYIEILFKRHDEYLLGDKIKKNLFIHIKEQITDKKLDMTMIEIIIEYQISAALSVIKYWYQHEKAIPIQEMLNKIFIISSKGALQTLQAELDKSYELKNKS